MATPTPNLPTPQAVWPTSLKVVAALVAGAVFSAVSLLQWVPEDAQTTSAAGTVAVPQGGFYVEDDTTAADTGTGPATAGPSGSSGATSAGSSSGSAGGAGAGLSGGVKGGAGGGSDATKGGALECKAGKNGGETDKGVTGDKIKLASNMVTDGVGKNFLNLSPDGMEAIKLRVNNKEGGICGRTLELKMVNDSWDAARGHDNIKNFIKENYFALPVLPSSEGLSAAIDAGTIQKEGIPVVGTDGMRKEQYAASGNAEWVWPVAVATVSQVRIMAKWAYDKAKAQGISNPKFGIVYDKVYKFGVEGADAYEKYIKENLSDATLAARTAIEPGKTSYSNEADQFKQKCGPCDVVVLLLEPQTGKTWMKSAQEGGKGTVMTGGAQPLFNEEFAANCGEICNGIVVWTGYNPPIGGNLSDPDVSAYVDEVRQVNPNADVTNQFLQGAYLGMEVFVEAMKKCSPNLTRACVKTTMDSMTYQTGLTSTLKWAAGNHFANLGARAYSVAYDGPNFTGFRDEQTGFVKDPTPGVVPG